MRGRRVVGKLTHLEVQNVYLKRGVDGVREIIDDERASAHTLRRALSELEDDKDVAAQPMADLLQRLGFLSTSLQKPDVGDVREYSIITEKGRQIVKVPVDYLQQETGSALRIRFDVNGFRGDVPEDKKQPWKSSS